MTRGLGAFLLVRSTVAAVALLVSSFVVFGALYLAPGSPTDFLMGNRPASTTLVEQVREQYRLDDPFLTRYWLWLRDVATGDFGESALQRRPVTDLVGDRLPLTLQLVALTLVLVLVVGIALGALAAYRGGIVDDAVVAGTSVLSATPAFVSAVILITFFGVRLGWFPVFGPGEGGVDRLEHLVLPCVALSAAWIPILAQTSRSAFAQQLRSEYVETARARGLGAVRIFWRHVLPNALRPILAASGLTVAGLLATSALVEVAFQLPGTGALLISSVTAKDFPVVQALCLLLVTVFVLVNVGVELVTRLLDPRSSHGSRA